MCLNSLLLVCVSPNISRVIRGGPTGSCQEKFSDLNALPYTKDSRLMNAMSPQLAFVGSLYFPRCLSSLKTPGKSDHNFESKKLSIYISIKTLVNIICRFKESILSPVIKWENELVNVSSINIKTTQICLHGEVFLLEEK